MHMVRPLLHFRLFGSTVLTAAVLLAPLSATHAQEIGNEDTRLRLDQNLRQQSNEAEKKFLEGADAIDAPPSTLKIDGKTYSVSDNVNDIGMALYVSITYKNWADVRRFLKAYLRQEKRDPMLVLYAEGAVARVCGDLHAAEQYYRQLLRTHADFLPGRLELARVLFENHQDDDALMEFTVARAALERQGKKATGVLRTVDAFLAALRRRRGWQGFFALGPSYSTNLNQSSDSYTCLLTGADGTCLFERKVPDPIAAVDINFEGSLARRIPIGGHGGMQGRVFVYGDVYPGHHDYSQTTLSTQIGYDYQASQDTLSLAPSYDIGTLKSAILYDAWGGDVSWLHNFSPTAVLKIETKLRRLDYRLASYEPYDGLLSETYLTAWYMPFRGWTIFGGPDFTDKLADDAANAYRQYGMRAGFNTSFGSWVQLLAFASLRYRVYGAYSALLEAKRHDWNQNYTMIVSLPALRLAGLTPEIKAQHYRVHSSVAWLYSYDCTTVSLRWKYAF